MTLDLTIFYYSKLFKAIMFVSIQKNCFAVSYLSKVVRLDVFQLEIGSLVAEDDSACGDCHVVEGVLPVVTEPGGLDGRHLQTDLQTVDDQSGQGLAVHILANDDQGLLNLNFIDKND